jgi:hypothetical protein
MKPNFKKTEGNKLIAIVGDEVPASLLRTQSPASSSPESASATSAARQTTSLLTRVPPSLLAESTKQSVDAAFGRFLRDANISVVLVTQ